ncbi:MAG: helix-hairpin-helix domain-containing protein [Maritimibacter harenae]
MANNDSGLFSCRNTCWIVGGLVGLVVLLLINSPWIWAIIAGIVVAVAVALILQRMFCSDVPASAGSTAGTGAAPAPAAKTDASEPAAAAASSAGTGDVDAAAAKPAPATEASAEAQEAEPSPDPFITPSKDLPGQRELESKKGEWKYEGGDAEAPKSAKPAAKAAPAAGGADDLKMIKGVGPGIEKKLNDAGITTFAQIAAWSVADIEKMDDMLSFRGRIKRDDWVTQAKSLASGEETEFSKKASSSGRYDEKK